MKQLWLGVDTGGTFTDFVLYDGAALRVHKVLSTPVAPEQAILQGLTDLGLLAPECFASLYLVHGSTVATNAVLEGKGVRTAYVTNRGLGDVLRIGRQNRRELYSLQPPLVPPPVPPELCLETGGRLAADGAVVEPLTEEDLRALAERLRVLAPEAVAINLLFSFRDDRFEKTIAEVVPPGMFVSRSSEVLPEYREYERGIATWLNAWVGPLMARYLERLATLLEGARISVMQSSGGTVELAQASRKAVRLLLSGPAGGLAAARFIGELAGRPRLLTFDMGGTSTDVALIDGDIQLTSEGRIGDYPVAVPMVDLHTIGAGGGSLASVDAGGLLQVGPRSAAADPGPACYGRGGTAPTVTDANLVLGRLRADAFLGGGMRLDEAAARRAMGALAQALGLSVEAAALGVVQVANEHMAGALRVMSVQRGIDPRGLTLTSFGGAGGLHVCALAEALGMTQALVPVHAGVLSALGMLAAPRARRLSRTLNIPLQGQAQRDIERCFDELTSIGVAELLREGGARDAMTVNRTLDLRYRGQTFCLTVPWSDVADVAEAFGAAHAQRYGHRFDYPVELVTARVAVQGGPAPLGLQQLGIRPPGQPYATAHLHGIAQRVAVWAREQIGTGQTVHGPALITEALATTFLAPGWQARPDEFGNLLLTRPTSPP